MVGCIGVDCVVDKFAVLIGLSGLFVLLVLYNGSMSQQAFVEVLILLLLVATLLIVREELLLTVSTGL